MYSQSACFAAICLVSAAGAQPQTGPQLTARELFYSAAPASAKPAPAAKPQPARPPAKKAPATEVAGLSKSSTEPRPTGSDLPEGGRVIPAVANISGAPAAPSLGLKYVVLKSISGQMAEVPADSTFHAGDRIQLTVETNSAGYLYVISQGSSGAWKPMFPSAEVAEGNNRVEPFHSYLLPPKARMLFDEQTGVEKLFVIFSREPEPNLEKMIYSLQGVAPASAPKPAAPANAAPVGPKTLVAMADASIDDRTVGILRTAYSRDLVIEKVDQNTAGERKETAVYVVNPSGSADSRLVADLQLAHR